MATARKRELSSIHTIASKQEQNSPLVRINLSLLADEVRKALADTLNLAQGEHDLTPTVNVGVQHTQNVLKVRAHHERSLSLHR